MPSHFPFTVVDIAASIRRKERTAEGVAREVLSRCEDHQDLRALISQEAKLLLAAAREADRQIAMGGQLGPLHGVPILIKDNIDVRGYPTTAGTPGLVGVYPRAHAPVVQRLLSAGALIAGKANLHELAVGGTSHNLHFGAVLNPWRRELVAGGSSGGSAVAVAVRMVPAALGTDTNGSVRGPCSFEGIAGFRPTVGRYPYGGVFPASPTRDSIGTLATRIEDLCLLDSVLAGKSLPPAEVSLKGLRLGRPGGKFYEVVDERTLAVFEATAAMLRREGAVIVEEEIPGLHELAARTAWPISAYETVRAVPGFLAGRTSAVSIGAIVAKIASPTVRERFNPQVANLPKLQTAYRAAMDVHRPKLQALLAAYFADHRLDALIFPTTPFPAVAVADDTGDLVINGRNLPHGFGYLIQNTIYQSAAGIPSLTVPAGLTTDGLPVGLSLDGPAGSDRRLLAIGLAFEMARGEFPAPQISAAY